MPTHKSKNYKGGLATPICCLPLDDVKNDPYWRRRREQQLDAERVKKLPDLFDHYGITVEQSDGGKWTENGFKWALIDLVIKLAADHVPGFKPVVQRGPKKKSHFELWYLVWSRRQAEIEKGKKPNVSAICNSLTKRGAQFSSMKPRTLKRRYELEDKKPHEPLRRAAAWPRARITCALFIATICVR